MYKKSKGSVYRDMVEMGDGTGDPLLEEQGVELVDLAIGLGEDKAFIHGCSIIS